MLNFSGNFFFDLVTILSALNILIFFYLFVNTGLFDDIVSFAIFDYIETAFHRYTK